MKYIYALTVLFTLTACGVNFNTQYTVPDSSEDDVVEAYDSSLPITDPDSSVVLQDGDAQLNYHDADEYDAADANTYKDVISDVAEDHRHHCGN
jgi:hypothetical protein